MMTAAGSSRSWRPGMDEDADAFTSWSLIGALSRHLSLMAKELVESLPSCVGLHHVLTMAMENGRGRFSAEELMMGITNQRWRGMERSTNHACDGVEGRHRPINISSRTSLRGHLFEHILETTVLERRRSQHCSAGQPSLLSNSLLYSSIPQPHNATGHK